MTLASDVENIGPTIFTIMKNIEMHTLQKASQILKVFAFDIQLPKPGNPILTLSFDIDLDL